MFKKPPSWAYAPTASTDWSLIKQAKSMRGLSPTSRLKNEHNLIAKKQLVESLGSGVFVHELALDASGLSQKLKDSYRNPKKTSRCVLHSLVIFIMLCFGLSTLMINIELGRSMINSREVESNLIDTQRKHQLKLNKVENSKAVQQNRSISEIGVQRKPIVKENSKQVKRNRSIPEIVIKDKTNDVKKNIVNIVALHDRSDSSQGINSKSAPIKGLTANIQRIGEYLRQDSDLFFIFL